MPSGLFGGENCKSYGMNAMNSAVGTERHFRFRSTVLPTLVLLVGIPASLLLFVVVQSAVLRIVQLQFEGSASAANSVLENKLHSYTHVLYALRAMFSSDEPVSRSRFQRFVKSLEIQRRYPGFLALNFAAYVPRHSKESFEASVRADASIDAEGYPNFSIKPPGDRSEYFVLVFIEPMAGYEFAFGLDLAANPMATNTEKVAKAVYVGRDTGTLIASAQPLRVKRGKELVFLAIRLAVYKSGMPVDTISQRREAYIGSVGAGFDVESLITAALDSDALRHIRCKLYDVGLVAEQGKSRILTERRLLFDTASVNGGPGVQAVQVETKPSFVYRERMEIADRLWEFEYSAPRDAVMSPLDKWLPTLALGGGLITTFLLFGIVHTLATSRRRAEAMAKDITRELSESEAGLAEAQRIARLGNWTLDPTRWTMIWSAETYRLFGMRSLNAPVTFAAFLQHVHPADRAMVEQAIRDAVTSGKDCNIEHRLLPSHRTQRWVQTTVKPGTPNRLGHVPGVIMDITERKHADLDLKASHGQLQALSQRLVDVQEGERRRFSAELHDVAGQNLTALSINLDIIKTQLAGDKSEAIRARLDDSAGLLQATTAAIENVMAELRPPMLDDYGLLAALQWYAREIENRSGVHVEVAGDDSMQRLSPAAEIALFRVAQEALNNVVKHAHAKNVEIRIQRNATHCLMSVTDDGAGISAQSNTGRRRPGLGMVTMRERLQAVGGTIAVDGASGKGTRVDVRVPC